MERRILVPVLLLIATAPASAQFAVYDAATTARNTASAVLKEYILNTQRDQHSRLQEMARRLSAFANIRRYAVPDPPKWRTHGGDFLFIAPYNDALIFGDPAGAAYLAVSHAVSTAGSIPNTLTSAARRELTTRLATLNVADAAAIAGIHDTGQLRFNGRKHELPAIDALEAHVIDPSNEQSATAVLDKISGAVLIGARQRQARTQLLAALVEQLLIDSKRARDADAVAMNMQLVRWRDAQAANEAFVAGSGDALRTWRQP